MMLLIGHETINILEIFSGVHGFTGQTVNTFFDMKGRAIVQLFQHFLIQVFPKTGRHLHV